MSRISHPVWIRPRPVELEMVLGDCLASPVKNIDVTVANQYLDDPRVEAEIICLRFEDGHKIGNPFPLMDAADTNVEQTELGIEVVKVALDALCSTCTFRSTI